MSEVAAGFRAGFVALVGRPNVGKSTLLNALLERKLSIVTPTAQTTRQRVLGVLSRDLIQMVFLDTPGILEPRYELQQRMLDQALTAVADADVIVLMIEARERLRTRELELAHQVTSWAAGRPLIVALNKIDRFGKVHGLGRSGLLPLIAEVAALPGVNEVVPISALKRDGVDLLESVITRHLPESPPYFPPDALSDQPERFFVAEMVREQVFEQYGEEIPYSTAVVISEYDEKRDTVRIRAEIIVERDSQKAILIGRGGQALKRVGQAARKSIESFLGRPVFLELWTRTRKGWRSDRRFLGDLGL